MLESIEPGKTYSFSGGYTMNSGKGDVSYSSASNKLSLRFGRQLAVIKEIVDEPLLQAADWTQVLIYITVNLFKTSF